MSNETHQYPVWLPPDFRLEASETCPSPASVLKHLGLYNAIAILSFLLLRNIYVQALLSGDSARPLKPWRWFSPVSRLLFQVAGQVATAYLARGSSGINAWQIIQLWALRPRTTWFIGNLAQVKRRWGWMNAALSSIFSEVFICALATVFVGRIIHAALSRTGPPANDSSQTWYRMILSAGFVMLISTGAEILWALHIHFSDLPGRR